MIQRPLELALNEAGRHSETGGDLRYRQAFDARGHKNGATLRRELLERLHQHTNRRPPCGDALGIKLVMSEPQQELDFRARQPASFRTTSIGRDIERQTER
jgi:hypothetical protein